MLCLSRFYSRASQAAAMEIQLARRLTSHSGVDKHGALRILKLLRLGEATTKGTPDENQQPIALVLTP